MKSLGCSDDAQGRGKLDFDIDQRWSVCGFALGLKYCQSRFSIINFEADEQSIKACQASESAKLIIYKPLNGHWITLKSKIRGNHLPHNIVVVRFIVYCSCPFDNNNELDILY